jgi:amino acid transporter
MAIESSTPTTPVSTPAQSRKVLNLGALLAASIGVIVAQLGMVALMQGVGIGGWGFFAALLIAFALALTNAMAYAEMALMMPSAGSLSSYAEAAIGNLPAIMLVFAGYVTPAIFGLPAELVLADQIVSKVLPVALPQFALPVAVVLIFTVLNIFGTDIFAKVQTTLSFTVLVFLLVTGLAALSGQGAAPLPAAPDAGWAAMGKDSVTLGLVALAFWVFVGSEFVTPLVVEARNPDKDLPRAMLGGLVMIAVVQVVFALGGALFVPRATLAASPTPHLDYVIGVFGPGAAVWFAVLALLATASLVNTVLAAVPRMLWGMAMNGQVFPFFKHQHRRYGTPVAAIVFVGALPLIGLAWSNGDPAAILPLTIAASVAWLLAYMMAQVSLIVLRLRHPDMPRPFRMPGFPLLPALAIGGMAYVVINSAPTPEMAPQIAQYTGIVLVLFALISTAWVKLVMKKGLFEPGLPVMNQTRDD